MSLRHIFILDSTAGRLARLLLDPLYRCSALHPGKSGGLVIVVGGGGRIDLEKGPSAAKPAPHL